MEGITFPDGVEAVRLGPDGQLAGLAIETPLCSARVALQGAQVLSFRARGEKPLLWLSTRAQYVPGKAIRGGIPLCFPWFGPHADDPLQPQHGFARTRDWQLVAATRQADGRVELVLRLEDDAQTRACWPHAFRAELTLLLGAALSCRFTLWNTGQQDFRVGFAFHSYFPVSDVLAVRAEGLAGARCIDQLAPADPLPVVDDVLRFSGETDRIFLAAGGDYRVVDEAVDECIRIQSGGCRSVVVWNPWQEKSGRMADMAPGAWRQMLCVECGNVGADQLTMPPGAASVFALELCNG